MMKILRAILGAFLCAILCLQASAADSPLLLALQKAVEDKEIVGGLVQTGGLDGIDQSVMSGHADLASKRLIKEDDIFWIASMTKPITGTAVMMLVEQGKLSLNDSVERYLPEFKNLKNADGQHVSITVLQCLTHTSGLADLAQGEDAGMQTLSDLTHKVVTKPLLFAPGSKWQYCQTGINTAARVVEVISGKNFDVFLQDELFRPLGMNDTGFYLSENQTSRLACSYRKASDGTWEVAPLKFLLGESAAEKRRYPRANGGLFSTAHDYGLFARMILNGGTWEGKRYLKETSVKTMTSIHSGDLVTGFTPGNGWGVGWCVVNQPQGVSATLSPGSFGHGGAYGTQVWIDPVKKRYFLLLVQRADFPNSDDSSVRKSLQQAAWKGTKP